MLERIQPDFAVIAPVKGRKLQMSFEHMGLPDMARRYDVELVNLTHEPQRKFVPSQPLFVREFDLPQRLLETDLIINIPKVKTHKYATITVSIKNMFGTIPDPLRIRYHADIHRTIVDLITCYEERMVVVTDGIVGMEGSGPLWGQPVDLGILLFGNHPFEMDWLVAQIMGFDPRSVKHLELYLAAHRRGQPPEFHCTGIPPGDVARRFEPCHKNLFVTLEGFAMKFRVPRALVFNPWLQRHVIRRLHPLLSRLRGGSYTWYVD